MPGDQTLRLNSIHNFNDFLPQKIASFLVQSDVMFTYQLAKHRPVVCKFWEIINIYKIKEVGCLRLQSFHSFREVCDRVFKI